MDVPRLFLLLSPFHVKPPRWFLNDKRHQTTTPSLVLSPSPPDETPEEQDLRIAAELEAEQVSDAIDDELNRQRIADKKKLKPVKILLLGALSAPLPTPPRSTTTPPSSWQVRANPVCRHIMTWLSPLSVLSRKIYYPEE